jgi:glycosyltransferase involved in cell wall biosynthesis
VSATHAVLIPSYNTGPKLVETVTEACRAWPSVFVVIDGSTDGSDQVLKRASADLPGLVILGLSKNSGKGAAILAGLEAASAAGFTHVLTMDSDGQHPASMIPAFMKLSAENPGALILGRPVFDASAPAIRIAGRKLSNWWANLETLWAGIGDSLFGFRVYPVADLLAVMRPSPWMKHFDFDPEAAVRMVWRGCNPINVPAPVRYFTPAEGGVSHFNYLRDNLWLVWMHTRLFCGFLVRVPGFLNSSSRARTCSGRGDPERQP